MTTNTYQAMARSLIPEWELQDENNRRRALGGNTMPVKNQMGDWMSYGDYPTLEEARDALGVARGQGKQTRILYGDPYVAGGKKVVEETPLRDVPYEATDVVGY